MAPRPASLDHVNILVRGADRSYRRYTDVFDLHTQDTMTHPGSDRLRAAVMSCDKDHAHDIALLEVVEEAGSQERDHGQGRLPGPGDGGAR